MSYALVSNLFSKDLALSYFGGRFNKVSELFLCFLSIYNFRISDIDLLFMA